MSWLNNLKTNLRGTGANISTVDAAKAAPPPSPLAPVDLTNPAHLTGVMEIAARIGEILISSGNSNSDVRAQIHSVLSAYGLYQAHVDITTKPSPSTPISAPSTSASPSTSSALHLT